MHTQIEKLNKIALTISMIACFCSFTYLFYKMAVANIDTSKPEFWLDPYYSDLPFHIETANESYSLMGIVMRIVYTAFSFDTASVLLALTLSVIQLMTVYSTYLLLIELSRAAGHDIKPVDRLFFQWLSLASIFIVSYYIPPLLPSFYYYAINMTCWQNDTYFGMRLFSILTVLFFIKITTKLKNANEKRNLLLFSLFLLVSTWMKPNFFIGFVILLFIVALWCLALNTDKIATIKHWIIIAICTFPSIICVLLQNALIYGSSKEDSIIFDPFLVIDMHITNWQLAIAVVLLFPIIVTLLEKRTPGVKKTFGYVLFLFFIIEYSFGLLLAESGPRMFDFNFWWGMTISNSLLYIWTFHTWYQGIQHRISVNSVTPHAKKTTTAYLFIGLGLLLYLTCTGLVFFTLLTTGTVSFIY